MTPHVDTPALPRVPPAASPQLRVRDIVASALFVAAIATMGLSAFRPPRQVALGAENRTMSPWPKPALTRAFAAAFERAFADRFGGRDALLRLHNRTLVRAFGVSPAPHVMIGRDGWLFFLGEEGTSFDRYYRGTPAMTDTELHSVLAELERRNRFLASHRIAYVVTIAPDKATIYPEHLPRWATTPAQRTPLERLTEAIRANGTLRYVDLRAPLAAAKAGERVYYATDSHWNFLGASVAYREIMSAVSAALVAKAVTPAPVALPPYVPGVDIYRGDLARMTGDAGHFAEPDYAPLGKILAAPQSRCGKRLDAGDDVGFEWYACSSRPGLPRAVVYRDSMAIPLIPMLSENFSRVAYVSSQRLDPAFVLRERPDVVVEEMVERAMLSPVATPMPQPQPDR
jgi:alginate O-acetyltransferase complex protein AlgJ